MTAGRQYVSTISAVHSVSALCAML